LHNMLPLHVGPPGRGLMASASTSSSLKRGSLGSMSSLHDVGAPKTEDDATMRRVTLLGLIVGLSSFVVLVIFAVLSARILNIDAVSGSGGAPGVPATMGGAGGSVRGDAAGAAAGYGGVTPIELVPFGDSRWGGCTSWGVRVVAVKLKAESSCPKALESARFQPLSL
jgi:hypothetical protein